MATEAALDVPLPVSTQSDLEFQKFTTSDHDRTSYLGPLSPNVDLPQTLSKHYMIDDLVDFFKRNPQYKRITLQFPDFLVMDSSFVIRLLQDSFKDDEQDRQFWVLADTAYSSCCVDEVAAEHVNADMVVHFGDACLNAIQKLPVVYTFGIPFLQVDDIMKTFMETFKEKNEKICIMGNAPFTFYIRTIFEKLHEEGYQNIIYATINDNLINDNVTIIGKDKLINTEDNVTFELGNRKLYAKDNIKLEESDLQCDYSLFHISIPQDPRLLYLTTMFKSSHLYDTQDNTITTGPFPSLMKRYKYMHVARTAGCIGILVNTLSLRSTKETINRLIQLIKDNGKKHYLFVVGKPNVAKLANFDSVDIWCILGCGQSGIVLDQYNEFYKPIVTPYELTMALKADVTWTGKWIVDFETVLNEIEEQDDAEDNDKDSNEEDDGAPEFDAVTGNYVSNSRPLRALQHLELESPADSKDLIRTVTGGAVIKGTVSTAAARLQERHWKGLGSDFNADVDYEEDGATVEEGITGVARGYQFDVKDATEKN
ncbi:hypothetical protein KAFR_0I00580 [Kazachstania africana CBS 2517]|uniref:2-(3-amino-3-carboxypropyl)histidine synthase subunit 2 n=1 Tax=Kazachstania africana (strain ATCC 22294 / BCRC 22015 / CBS 2517 / CECT 1963 / NBRC 1671 / NRRL Y-8276) TaxID=1071382 RepID=H2AZN9_KAZAF|nr:hypothetical protein KAFR_0I00580 [Kazachstania africana CBS 2517]CCF59839.1 hypothetical protein KAFR_0I00580 [Kazachstania africana CBS 2517]